MVAIIDYGLGNLASVKKALDSINVDCVITDDHEVISASNCIVLPGVGSFRQGMDNLRDRGLDVLLTEEVLKKKKSFFGICLGMQLIFAKGTEPDECKGLGWIEGTVTKIKNDGLRIPHMGWNSIKVINEGILKKSETSDVYFIHSYHVIPDKSDVVAATVEYGSELVASVLKDNIFATQFHPEKSQETGLSILRSYFKTNA